MKINLKIILIVLAAICFALAAFEVKGKWAINWTPAGFCLLTIALLLLP